MAGPQTQSESPRSPPLSAGLAQAGKAICAVLAGHNLTQALANVAPEVRPLTMDLAYGATRRLARYRFILERLLLRTDIEAEVLGLLLAALQALHARPQDPHMVVDQAVTAASKVGRGNAKGLVNAVLRNYLRRRSELETGADADPVTRLNYPAWWITRLQQAYPEQWESILTAGNAHPPLGLRVNQRALRAAEYLQQLAAAGLHGRAVGEVGVVLGAPVPVERLPGFAQGQVSVQDCGAQLAAPMLDAHAGMRVLDACAAPGGKSGHLLELGDIDLTAVDIDETRLTKVRQNLTRLGLQAHLMCADCSEPDVPWWNGEPFERILLDAPCTASGVVRRHPDSKWLRRETDLAGFTQTQAQMLETLWHMLARGGKLLYATCSVFPEENAERIAAFLETHREARLLHPLDDGQLLPDRDHDGFFYALLERQR